MAFTMPAIKATVDEIIRRYDLPKTYATRIMVFGQVADKIIAEFSMDDSLSIVMEISVEIVRLRKEQAMFGPELSKWE